jgi:NitT/TauT family transport system permease protein
MSVKTRGQVAKKIRTVAFLCALLCVWELATTVFGIPKIILPAPSAIALRTWDLMISGLIWPHVFATAASVLSGFAIGVIAGVVLGGMISLLPALEEFVYPYIVALQTIPKLAIAPLFIVWFGYGLTSKIVITALVCFFPIIVNVMAGLHSTDHDQLEMMKSFGATRWQILYRLRIPSASVLFFAGLEIAAVLAVIGAIVGEFVGAQVGLGYLITVLNFNLDVPGVFSVLIFLSLLGIGLHGAVKQLGRRCIFWTRTEDRTTA